MEALDVAQEMVQTGGDVMVWGIAWLIYKQTKISDALADLDKRVALLELTKGGNNAATT